jgi:hypothetical protein
MDDWLQGLADSLGVTRLDERQQEELLEVARDVAHRVERKVTPLAAFLLGRAVEARGGDVASAIAALRGSLPPGMAPPEPPA